MWEGDVQSHIDSIVLVKVGDRHLGRRVDVDEDNELGQEEHRHQRYRRYCHYRISRIGKEEGEIDSLYLIWHC